MPKKALVRSMAVWNTVQKADRLGIKVQNSEIDWSVVMGRKNKHIDRFVGGKGPYLDKLGVDLLMGTASFVDQQTIKVNEKMYSADKILIGVGSESILPQIEGIEHAITSKELLFLENVPKSMVVIGGGIIAMEFAHVFASAGTKVTLLQRGDRVLKMMDVDSSKTIEELSKNMGIEIKLHSNTQKIEQKSGVKKVFYSTPDGEFEAEGEIVLVAIGRKPAIDELNLEAAGVQYDEKGIKVNEFFQTTSEYIYAAGDSIGGYMFTPIAGYQAKIAVQNALKGNKKVVNHLALPTSVFTLPPVSSIGLTEQEAQEKGIQYAVGKLPYKHTGTAILLDETEGHFKVLIDKETEQIIGAHIVGADADELIHLIAVAMKGSLTVSDFIDIIPVHPTLSESLIELIRSIN